MPYVYAHIHISLDGRQLIIKRNAAFWYSRIPNGAYISTISANVTAVGRKMPSQIGRRWRRKMKLGNEKRQELTGRLCTG